MNSNPKFGIEKVVLYGSLRKLFGKELLIKGESVARVLSIIEANFQGKFFKALREGEFFVWTGKGNGIDNPEQLMFTTSDKELHILPKVQGAGASSNKGGAMAILGALLVGAAIFFTGGLAAGGLGAAFTGMQGTVWGTVANMGAGLILNGIGTMLSPMPDMNTSVPGGTKNSYIYGGPVNSIYEGGAIPVIYGAPIVGSTVISGSISIEQLLEN